jgi:hypothetical protein
MAITKKRILTRVLLVRARCTCTALVKASALAEVIMQFERKVGVLYAGNNGEQPINPISL